MTTPWRGPPPAPGPPPLSAVAATALGVARARALETSREDRLFADPYAEFFVSAGGGPKLGPDLSADAHRALVGMYHWIVARTCFLDELCTAAAADGLRQVVILGAGLDARAFRLDWPDGTVVYEVDRDEIFRFKEGVLAAAAATPRCRRTVVVADLASDWLERLRAAGFDPRRPTLWLAEGLLTYLHPDTVAHLLHLLTASSAAESRAGITAPRRDHRNDARPADDPLREVRALWHDVGFDVAERLREHGWTVRSSTSREVLVTKGRIPAEPPAEGETPATGADRPRLYSARLAV